MRQSTIVLLFLLALTLLAAWFFTTHEKVSRQEFIGYQGEARFNPFLAAELLLTEVGIDADARASLTPSDWLPVNSDTIVSRSSAAIAVGTERELLTDWVTNGGHLVLLPAKQESRLTEEFLAYFGFRLVEVEPDGPEDADEDNTDADDDDPESYTYILDLKNTRYRIEANEEGAIGAYLYDDKGNIAARRAWGSGYVTVVASTIYFSNESIDQSDHARLLMDIVAGHVNPGQVWFIYDSTFPSLWQVIWSKAPYAVIGLAVALALWLWSIAPTFGPAIAPEPMQRRSIIEHVRAAGHFVWRSRGARALAASTTTALMQEAEFRRPGISRLSMEGQARQIALITGLSAQDILDTLVHQAEPRKSEFTHNMQALQAIRKEL